MFRWKSVVRSALALLVAVLFVSAGPAFAAPGPHQKLDSTLSKRAAGGRGTSRVIVVVSSELAGSEVRKLGGTLGRRLNLIGAQVLEIPDRQLAKLAALPAVRSVHHDRPFVSLMNRVAVSSGARSVHYMLGLTGAGIGVAVVDSGVTPWHDDLSNQSASPAVQGLGGQRVAAFVDFVGGQQVPYDDYGHGTHVSGIIAGNGLDSWGMRAGIAPSAHLVSLKVLDGNGRGVVSNVIAALDYAVTNRHTYNIRVVNLSVGAPVTESFLTDPLTLAAKRAVDAGMVVVAAAGNLGKNALGQPQYGGIMAPANAPWVLTVGASSHQGTLPRFDDVIAAYSSRGPTAFDYGAKPDLVAHGTGIESLSNPASLLYSTKAPFLVSGNVDVGYKPYLSLSGTSMAAPAVSGTVALMLEANPGLTPNLVKAILQYTAQTHASYNALTQGAGFLNARGAVDLARYFAGATAGQPYPVHAMWSQRIIWGNKRVSGGGLLPGANAWLLGTTWGATSDGDGDNIVWGTRCDVDGDTDCDNIVWGTSDGDGDNIVWGTSDGDGDNIVWGTSDGDGDNIVWGTTCGGDDCFNIIWGTHDGDGDNIVWGTDDGDGDNIIWGTDDGDGDNIVWGTADGDGDGDGDNIVWGTSDGDGDNIVWGTTTDVSYAPTDPTLAHASHIWWYVLVWYWEWQDLFRDWLLAGGLTGGAL